MEQSKIRQLIETEQTIREASDQEVGGGMESSTLDFCMLNAKKMSLSYAPIRFRFCIAAHILLVIAHVTIKDVGPLKHCTILTDCVYLPQNQ